MRNQLVRSWAFAACLLLGCAKGDDGVGNGGSNDTETPSVSAVCAQYCDLQATLNCQKSETVAECSRTCNDPINFSPCDMLYAEMKRCMVEKGLFCDPQGYPAVGEECFPQVDDFIDCDFSNLGAAGNDSGGTSGANGGASGAGGVTSTGGNAGISTGGSAGIGTGGTGGAMPVTVQTNQPQLTFSGTGDIVITSAFITLENFGGFTSLQIQGDLLNTSNQLQCIPLINLSLGDQNILSVAKGQGYLIQDSLSSSSFPCLTPHGTAMFTSIQNEVAPTLLATASQVIYQITSIVSPNSIPHPAIPTQVTADVEPGQFSDWQVSGHMMATATSVDFLDVDVFPRNAQGLAFDHLTFTEDAVVPGATLNFTTASTDTAFTDFDLFVDVTILQTTTTQSLSLGATTENSIAAQGRIHSARLREAATSWSRVKQGH